MIVFSFSQYDDSGLYNVTRLYNTKEELYFNWFDSFKDDYGIVWEDDYGVPVDVNEVFEGKWNEQIFYTEDEGMYMFTVLYV